MKTHQISIEFTNHCNMALKELAVRFWSWFNSLFYREYEWVLQKEE